MISMREMARRKKGIEAICQMAKAMRLVSTVRFQQLRDRAEKAERSFDLLRRTMADLAEAVEQTHPYLDGGKTAARGAVFITADRGMAGGYTTALIRCLAKAGVRRGADSGRWGKRGLYCCPAVDLRFREPPRTGCVRGRQRTPSPGNCSELTGLGRSERSICFLPVWAGGWDWNRKASGYFHWRNRKACRRRNRP